MIVDEILILDAAADDLEIGRGFCELGVGDYFVETLLSDIASVRFFAGTHPKFYGFFRLLSKRFPFAIYYDIDENIARIAAILDMRRSPEAISEVLRAR